MYYTVVVISLCAVLGILCVLIHENGRFDKTLKRRFYATYLVIACAMLAEWGAIILNGAAAETMELHKWVKALDYIISPMAGVMFVHQVNPGTNSRTLRMTIAGILAGNALLQIASVFTGWTFFVDETNYYHHGPLFAVYSVVFVLAFLYALTEFLKYGKRYSRKNITSLLLTAVFFSAELALQEIVGGDMRTLCVGLTMTSCLLFVHYSEFAQIDRDNIMRLQDELLRKDVMTDLSSRYAYNTALNDMSRTEIPADTVVFSADVTMLKTANDTYGHLAGDELICGAAACIQKVLGAYGSCYRTGGDEFVCILHITKAQAEALYLRLKEEAALWKGTIVNELQLAIGMAFASETAGEPVEKLISLADQRMYADKDLYYKKSGLTRRHAVING
ncbi:MAG: GGDEF domain-containing protein [Clostridia bacterium]|nr:GGDEF domain-containing protein [Clostridia bacterium]